MKRAEIIDIVKAKLLSDPNIDSVNSDGWNLRVKDKDGCVHRVDVGIDFDDLYEKMCLEALYD